MTALQLARTDTLILTAAADGVVVTYRSAETIAHRPVVPLAAAAETGRIGAVGLTERERAILAQWRREIERPDLAALIATAQRRS